MAHVEFTVLDEFLPIYIISRGMKHINLPCDKVQNRIFLNFSFLSVDNASLKACFVVTNDLNVFMMFPMRR